MNTKPFSEIKRTAASIYNLWIRSNESFWNRILWILENKISEWNYHLKIFFVGYEFNISAPLYKPNFVRINFESFVVTLVDFGRSGRWAFVAFSNISSPTLSLNLFFSHRTLLMFSIHSYHEADCNRTSLSPVRVGCQRSQMLIGMLIPHREWNMFADMSAP